MTLLDCGHEGPAFGEPACEHLRTREPRWIGAIHWYTGRGLDRELICAACAAARREGREVATGRLCEACFEFLTDHVADPSGVGGQAEIRVRDEPFDVQVIDTPFPSWLGAVHDAAAITDRPGWWLLLTVDGRIATFDLQDGACEVVATTSVPEEPDHKPWNHRQLRRRLHVCPEGRFAAVVNDHGRWGEILHLRSGAVTARLDGGTYHPETVPFSFAFARPGGRTVAVHRSDWNRLDLSDPATGSSLSAREYESVEKGRSPRHYLDYFHGALTVSPDGNALLDDGWVWHPVGLPRVWRLDRWLENPWESEDGPTARYLDQRVYYWDVGMAWIGNDRVAIEGIGDDDVRMIPGARIFDVSGKELQTVVGPAGALFHHDGDLVSSDAAGLKRWSLVDGALTGAIGGIHATRHHPTSRELVEVRSDGLRRARLPATR